MLNVDSQDFKTIFTSIQLEERVKELASSISQDYSGKTLDVICLVNSASFFCADLVRAITTPVRLHFLGFNSYANASGSGEVRITLDVTEPLYGRHVLVVEGIVVSGRTPRYLIDTLSHRQPSSIAMCALGIKPAQLSVQLPLKYVGFELGSELIVGYGIGGSEEKTQSFLFSKTNSMEPKSTDNQKCAV